MPPITLTIHVKFEADDVVGTLLADVQALASATFVACTAVTCTHDREKSQHTVTFSCAMSETDEPRRSWPAAFKYKGLMPSIVEAALQACPDTNAFPGLAAMSRAASGTLELK